MALRIKGAAATCSTSSTSSPSTRAALSPDARQSLTTAAEDPGFVLGAQVSGRVVAHHGSRVVVMQCQDHEEQEEEKEEEEEEAEARYETPGVGAGKIKALGYRRRAALRYSCSLTPNLKQTGVVTGDLVKYAPVLAGDESEAGARGVITQRLPRATELSRPTRALGEVKQEDLESVGSEELLRRMGAKKVLCANVDQAVFVFAPEPAAELVILDSYIVACLQSGIEPVMVFNKADLIQQNLASAQHKDGEEGQDERPEEQHKRILGRSLNGRMKTGPLLPGAFGVYRHMGYTVIQTSTVTGEGMEDVRQKLKGRTSILIGQSGVGKSSLLNTLVPGAAMRVGALSEMGLGSHTTSHAEMHQLPSGGQLIDCAGFRDFEIWHLNYLDIQNGFVDIARAAQVCVTTRVFTLY